MEHHTRRFSRDRAQPVAFLRKTFPPAPSTEEETGVNRQGSQDSVMDNAALETIAQSVVRQGLAGAGENELLSAFCERCGQAGLALSSAMAVIDTASHLGRTCLSLAQ